VRLLPSAVLAAVLASLVAASAPAQGVTRDELTDFADRASAVWAERQDAGGEFLDPHRDRPSGGYGNGLIGYGLLRAGERRGDERLIRAGVRGVDAMLDEEPAVRGVFDLLAVAAAYNFARESLPDDPAFAAARPGWEAYLRETGPPNIENSAQACILDPACFHNHEAVEATANLELLAAEIVAPALGDPVTLRAAALTEVGQVEPSFARGSARIEGDDPRGGLGLLSDTGSWPLAYHALSTAMLARSIELLGEGAPDTARDALRRTAGATAGFMAPDGTVAYIGRRQEVIWSLAGTIVATQRDEPAAAERAFRRLKGRYPLTPRGLPIVPRRGEDAFSPKGLDGRAMVFNGIAIYLLNVAADSAPARERPAEPLPADSDGSFVDAEQGGFATVRRGDVWFAVHGKPDEPDLRSDFGLVAAKWRPPTGGWIDVVRPRPLAYDPAETAGPVIERGGRRIMPGDGSISVREDGTVIAGGVRFRPRPRGVRISLPAEAGDVVTYTAYVPEGTDPREAVRARPAPAPEQAERTFASCCDLRMIALRYPIEMRDDGTAAYEVAAPAPPAAAPAPAGETTEDDSRSRWPIVLTVLGLVALALLARSRVAG
jgi:hypothetical protein